MSILAILRANIRSKKSNFISVSLLMFVITLVITVSCSVNENSKKRAGQSLSEAKAGDLCCYYKENVLTEEMIEKAKAYEQVEGVHRIPCIMIYAENSVTIGEQQTKDRMLFQTYDKENMPYPVFAQNNLEFVQEAEPLKEGEIYLPVSYQTKYACKAGDLVEVKCETINKTFHIKAFVEDITVGNPLISGAKNVWISQSDYEVLKKADEKGDAFLSSADNLMIYQKKDSKLQEKEFKGEIDKRTGIISASYFMVSKNDFITYATMMTDIFSAVMVVFAVLMFAGVLGIVGHSITSMIELEYTNLGILKSQGYRKRELQFVYFCQYLLAGAIGGILGFFASFPSVYFISGQLVQLAALLPEHKISYCFSLAAVFLMLGCIGGFAWMKAGKIGRISPMRAISGGRDSNYFSPRIHTTLGKGGLSLRMMLRQIASNAKQYVSSLLIVAMLVYFIMAVTSTMSSLDEENMLKDYYGMEFDLNVGYENAMEKKTEIESMIEEYAGIERSYMCPMVYLMLDGDSIAVMAPESSEEFTNVYNGREPRYENEVVITEIIAKTYHLSIGDTVTLTHGKDSRDFLITGYFQSVQNAGKALAMLKKGLSRFEFSESQLAQYNYLVSDKEQISSLAEKLQEQYGEHVYIINVQGIVESLRTISDATLLSCLLIYGISILFILVAAYMVCDKVFLKERNDYGIYKSQGFTTGHLRLQFSLRFLAVAFVGGVFGAVCNVLTNDSLIGMALSSMGITHFLTSYGFWDCALPVLVLAAVFFLFAWLISGRIKRVDTKSLIVE